MRRDGEYREKDREKMEGEYEKWKKIEKGEKEEE